jgi:hypothetical protein
MTALTDADVIEFVLAGCNAAEIAAYAGTDEATAAARIYRAQTQIAHPEFRREVA